VVVPKKGPIQLELFEPVHREYEYKVVLTTKAVEHDLKRLLDPLREAAAA
jgi:hypothetical protein